jgi:hypothetical protein
MPFLKLFRQARAIFASSEAIQTNPLSILFLKRFYCRDANHLRLTLSNILFYCGQYKTLNL